MGERSTAGSGSRRSAGRSRPGARPRPRGPGMEVHPHTTSTEGHAFDLESEPLFASLVARQSDSSARGHDAVPGQIIVSLQRSHGQSGSPRESRRRRYLSVSDHPSSGHSRDQISEQRQSGCHLVRRKQSSSKGGLLHRPCSRTLRRASATRNPEMPYRSRVERADEARAATGCGSGRRF